MLVYNKTIFYRGLLNLETGMVCTTEKGAGITETAISMALVGLVVVVSVSSFGGDVRSILSSRVSPAVGGDGGHLGDNSEQSQSSSAGLLEHDSRFAYDEMLAAPHDDGPLNPEFDDSYSDSSEASHGSSSSAGLSGALLPGHPQFDWNNIDWDWAVVAGIISEPKPNGPDSTSSSSGYQNSSIPELYAWDDPSPDDPSESFASSESDGSDGSES